MDFSSDFLKNLVAIAVTRTFGKSCFHLVKLGLSTGLLNTMKNDMSKEINEAIMCHA